jgi:hypothetical protein
MAGLVDPSAEARPSPGCTTCGLLTGKEDGTGRAISAVSMIKSGPLRVDGPHGRVPYHYTSEQITSVSAAQTYANTLRDRQEPKLRGGTHRGNAPRPEIEAGDWIEVGCPVKEGHVVYIPGEVTSTAGVRLASARADDVQGLMLLRGHLRRLNRTEWSQYITREKPALTWDRMPATWGRPRSMTWNDLP